MILERIDLALVALYIFWLFFALLIYYLQTENMREGYPLEDEDGNLAPEPGPVPAALAQDLPPAARARREDRAQLPLGGPQARAGADLGRPAASRTAPRAIRCATGVGAAAWAPRRDVPELDGKGHPKLVPLSALPDFSVAAGRDPRGLPVVAGDGEVAGEVVDIWIDEPEAIVRYLEVEIEGGGGTRLLPLYFARIKADRVQVRAIFSHHFADVPRHRSGEQVTLLEEEKISAYYGGGLRYASESRLGR